MSISELEQRINENKGRISEIDAILNQGEYETIQNAQELRSESRRLRDEIPLLERKIEKIKARQKDKALEAARQRLKAIDKEGTAIEVKILETQVDLLKKLSHLRILRGEANNLIRPSKELRPLKPQFRLLDDGKLIDLLRSKPHVLAKLWKKIEPQWREACKEYSKA